MSNGPRQGGVLSPYLFTRYIREMFGAVVDSGIGCSIGGMLINVLAYADDLVLIAPSWKTLQLLLDILNVQAAVIDMHCNTEKTVCLMFSPVNRRNSDSFPPIKIGKKNADVKNAGLENTVTTYKGGYCEWLWSSNWDSCESASTAVHRYVGLQCTSIWSRLKVSFHTLRGFVCASDDQM